MEPYVVCERGHLCPETTVASPSKCPICGGPVQPDVPQRSLWDSWTFRIVAATVLIVGLELLIAASASGDAVDRFVAAPFFMLILATPIGLIWAYMVLRFRQTSQRYREALRTAADQLQMIYAPRMHPHLQARFQALPLFRAGNRHYGRDLLQGNVDGQETLVNRFEVVYSHGQRSTRVEHLILLLPEMATALPPFALAPEGLADKLWSIFSGGDVAFEGSQLDSEFSKLYRLHSTEPAAVRRLLDERLQRHLLDQPGWTIQCAAGHLLLSRKEPRSYRDVLLSDPTPRPDTIGRLATEGRQLAEMLLAAGSLAGRARSSGESGRFG